MIGFYPSSVLMGLTNWHGGPIASDVIDDDIDIRNSNIINGGISVRAVAQDILVTVSNGNASVNAAGGPGNSTLHFYANPGRTINVNLSNELTFGSSPDRNFLITFNGEGNLVFNIGGGTKLLFASDAAGTATSFIINMDASSNSPQVSDVIFARSNMLGSSGLHARVVLGERCHIGFMAESLNHSATLSFNASNELAYAGRLILEINNGAGIHAEAYQNTNPAALPSNVLVGSFVRSNIDFNQRLDGNARILLVSSDPINNHAGLLVINKNQTLPVFLSNPWLEVLGSLTQEQPGFIIGKNGIVELSDGTYLDYVAASSNQSPNPVIPSYILDLHTQNNVPPLVSSLVKDRNPSALIIDGESGSFAAYGVDNSVKARILMNGKSAIYLRSGVNSEGTFVEGTNVGPDTGLVSPQQQLTNALGFGSIVFDVEGPLWIHGNGGENDANVIEVLSHQVNPIGGSVLIEGSETNFPLRTFASDFNNLPLQYGKAAMMINNRVEFSNVSLKHTDLLHSVFDKNFPQQSEATYIGGETFKLSQDEFLRPTMAFYNAKVLVHSDMALTGVDLRFPNAYFGQGSIVDSNISRLAFYANGGCFDQGTGRKLILGTNIGALSTSLGTVINNAAHLDVFQDRPLAAPFDTPSQVALRIETAFNNDKVIQDLTQSNHLIKTYPSIHAIYLANSTNVSIGTYPPDQKNYPNQAKGPGNVFFDVNAGYAPTLLVAGNFISFETEGGLIKRPSLSHIRGEGGIFVDQHGRFELANDKILSIGTMVSTSFNGSLDLKKRQTYFANGVGLARTRLDLTDPAQQELVAAGVQESDYLLDWKYITRGSCENPYVGVLPYLYSFIPAAGALPPLSSDNLVNLPVVRGSVDQFQIQNSRIGDPAHLIVDGGKIRELLLLQGEDSATAPLGVLVVAGHAEVGLGSADQSKDSSKADVVLGANGLSLVANGPAHIFLNEDVVINNTAHFLVGPDFGSSGVDRCVITSIIPRELRVKSDGVIDLTQFNSSNKRFVISGEVSLVLEPGARILGNGTTVELAGNAKIIYEPYTKQPLPVDTETYRVRWSGPDCTLLMIDNSQMILNEGAVVGIESAGPLIQEDSVGLDQTPINLISMGYLTSWIWELRDSAELNIGDESKYGGALQIGNTINQIDNLGSVSFTLRINGQDARVDINSQGFLGLGVGVLQKPQGAPNTWTLAPLFNVNGITLDVQQGVLRFAQIYSGDNEYAGLIAFENNTEASNRNFVWNQATGRILGGGNIAVVSEQGNVSVLDIMSSTTGIMVSSAMLRDGSKTDPLPASPMTSNVLFAYLSMVPFGAQNTPRAAIFQEGESETLIGYVDGSTIIRAIANSIVDTAGQPTDTRPSVKNGFVTLSRNAEIGSVTAVASL